jgi:hypothetical protein
MSPDLILKENTMSIKNRETPFTLRGSAYQAERFTGIRELGFNERDTFVVDAWTTPAGEPRGSYLTTVPISPLSYRRRDPTAAAYRRTLTTLTLYSDAGHTTTIGAPADVIDALTLECMARELPRKEG